MNLFKVLAWPDTIPAIFMNDGWLMGRNHIFCSWRLLARIFINCFGWLSVRQAKLLRMGVSNGFCFGSIKPGLKFLEASGVMKERKPFEILVEMTKFRLS